MVPLILTFLMAAGVIFGFWQFLASQKNWRKLHTLIGDSSANASYGKIADTITSIVDEERKNRKEGGSLSFRTATFIRRHIHGMYLTDSELRGILEEIGDKKIFADGSSVKMLRLVLQEPDVQISLDDIDFSRIAIEKESRLFFPETPYIYMDYLFNVWIMVWNTDEDRLDKQIQSFWTTIRKLIPTPVNMAVSNSFQSLEGFREAPNQCNVVVHTLTDEQKTDVFRTYGEVIRRKDEYVFTKEQEKNLFAACANGDGKASEDVLDQIFSANFVQRSLKPESARQLVLSLHLSVCNFCMKRGIRELPGRFCSFEEARHYILGMAGKGVSSRGEIEQHTISLIIDYIMKHYDNPALNLSTAAKDLGMKENYLYHFMSTRMDKTFSQYLEDYRLDRANELIMSQSDVSINNLGLKCGYCNPQTFRRAFKKRFGLVPSDFRNAAQSRQSTDQ